MSQKNDGGHAFAAASESGAQSGMSLRDYFAAAALAGLKLKSTEPIINTADLAVASEQVALCVYAVADAMLKERNKP